FLIAFQFLRVKSTREVFVEMDAAIKQRVESTGSRMEDIEGWSPLTEDTLKMLHLRDLPRKIGTFAEVIGKKDIFLVRAAQGRTFYIGDNPVVRHNSLDFGPYGNLGFDQKGMQIHLPLSAELTLCAYCPSIISAGIEENRQLMNRYRAELQAKAVQGLLTFREVSDKLKQMKDTCAAFELMNERLTKGLPIESNDCNVDFYNSLQLHW